MCVHGGGGGEMHEQFVRPGYFWSFYQCWAIHNCMENASALTFSLMLSPMSVTQCHNGPVCEVLHSLMTLT